MKLLVCASNGWGQPRRVRRRAYLLSVVVLALTYSIPLTYTPRGPCALAAGVQNPPCGADLLGATLVTPDTFPAFLKTGTSMIWPGKSFEWREAVTSSVDPDITAFDQAVRTAGGGVEVIGRFSTGSGWEKVLDDTGPYTHRPDSPPKNNAEFASFVTSTVAKYRGSIRYWQFMDEVFLDKVWLGSKEEYVNLLKACYPEVHKAGPEAKVVVASFNGRACAGWLISDLLAAGKDDEALSLYRGVFLGTIGDKSRYPSLASPAALRRFASRPRVARLVEFVRYAIMEGAPYYDVFSFHDYNRYRDPETFETLVRSILSKVKGQLHKPAFLLTSIGSDSTAAEDQRAAAVVTRLVTALGLGVDRALWWCFRDVTGRDAINARSGLLDSNGNPKGSYQTFTNLARKLEAVQASKFEPLQAQGSFRAWSASGSKESVIFAWALQGSVSASVPVGWQRARVTPLVPRQGASAAPVQDLPVREGTVSLTLTETPVLLENALAAG